MNSKYLLKKIFQSFITLLIVLTVSFILFRAMPGDPVSMFIKQGVSPEVVKAMKKNMGHAKASENVSTLVKEMAHG